MAKITGVFTSMKGKVGNAVMQTWKGIQVMRTHVIPANPQSAGQTTNRTLFTELVGMFKGILVPLVHKFWNPFTGAHETGWSNLIGANQLIGAGSAIDYESVVISKGSLPNEVITTATYDDTSGLVAVEWVDSLAEGSSSLDFVMVCAYDKVNNKWAFADGEENRGSETESVTLETGLTPADVVAYLFFFTGVFATPAIESVSNSAAKETIAPV